MEVRMYIFLLVLLDPVKAIQENEAESLHKKLSSLDETLSSLRYTIENQSKQIYELKSNGYLQERLIKTLLDTQREDRFRIKYLETIIHRLPDAILKDNVPFTNTTKDYIQLSNERTFLNQNNQVKRVTPTRTHPVQESRTEETNTIYSRQDRLITTSTRLVRDGTVAFYAYMSKPLSDTRPQQTLVFDIAVTNAGSGYNNQTGIFNPPITGYYAFSWSIYQYTGAKHSVEIVNNGVILGSHYVATPGTSDARFSSKTIVAHVSAGDDVYVRFEASCGGNVGNIWSNNCAQPSFSGWLIH